MPIAIKICGLSDERGVTSVIAARADYAGFVTFPASPRHVTFERAAQLKSLLPPSIQSVSVLVDPDDATLAQAQSILNPSYVQLHGAESLARIQTIKKIFPDMKIIKAISISSAEDLAQAADYEGIVGMLMFDAGAASQPDHGCQMLDDKKKSYPSSNIRHLTSGAPRLPGGNALSFDWALLNGHQFALPWFLSGGLNANNITEALRISGANMVDVSSGVESGRGVKDPALIAEFVKAAKNE